MGIQSRKHLPDGTAPKPYQARIDELKEKITTTHTIMGNCYSDEAYRMHDRRLNALISELNNLESMQAE